MPAESTSPTRVVIAEDEAIIRLDLKETLEEEGYEVVGETGRGDEAVLDGEHRVARNQGCGVAVGTQAEMHEVEHRRRPCHLP